MYILPQILNISSKNLLINQLITNFKNKLFSIIEEFMFDTSKNRYTNMFLTFQKVTNELSLSFFQTYFEALDSEFKNSSERKQKYFINKSNVERTLLFTAKMRDNS